MRLTQPPDKGFVSARDFNQYPENCKSCTDLYTAPAGHIYLKSGCWYINNGLCAQTAIVASKKTVGWSLSLSLSEP